MHWARLLIVRQEDTCEPARDLGGHFPQSHVNARAGGTLHFEIVSQVVMEFLERFDQEIVDREPDGPAPIRVATEKSGAGLRRLVVNAILHSIDRKAIGIVLVNAREGSQAERREEFV